MDHRAHVDASRARVKTRSGYFAQLCVPYSGGPIPLRLRRQASERLNEALRTDRAAPGQMHGVSIVVLPRHLLLNVAGSPACVGYWIEAGRLARAMGLALAESQRAAADARRPVRPDEDAPPATGRWLQRRRLPH